MEASSPGRISGDIALEGVGGEAMTHVGAEMLPAAETAPVLPALILVAYLVDRVPGRSRLRLTMGH
ncbi:MULTISPECIES: hypothetical protein [Streptomyces]|uniref:Uncharacterized protein n=2 Tax=Streptomyces TaxID=1883 RepID=A0ABW7TG84_9ACTN